MSNNSLPPLRNLPHWSRVGCLDKSFVPRPSPVVKHPYRLFDPPSPGRGAEGPPPSSMEDPRVLSLQRNLQFLQLQHKDTLQKLHGEIDQLRRENKDLQYKMIMEMPKLCRKGTSRRATRPPTQGSEANKGFYQEEALLDTRPSKDQGLSLGPSSEAPGPPSLEPKPELRGGLITSLQPLRIHSSPAHPPRAPTLHECEIIIRQLYNANSMQSQEILRVKAVLRDIVLSKKITPENYILTKSYLADGTRAETERFPKLELQPQPKKISSSQAGVAERVFLPALKQSLNSSVAERQKRTQAIHRSRLRRTVH